MKAKLAYEIADFLAKYQKKEGLIDSDEGRIVKNSYATEFYALMCSLLFKRTRQKTWKERAVKALESSIEIRRERAEIKGIYRWDFKNYALINSYILLKNEIDNVLKQRLVYMIKSWKNIPSFETNRIALTALNYLSRYREFGNVLDLLKAKSNINIVLKRQTEHGFFPDNIDSYSSQYHAYTLALLYQYYEITKDEKVKKAFLKGVNCITEHSFGRGKEQIFGYASIIYALNGAAKISKNRYYSEKAKKVFEYVSRFINKKSNYPIVLKNEKLYSYNHKSDYLSFFACYSLLMENINLGKMGFKKIKPTEVCIPDKISQLKIFSYKLRKCFFYFKSYIFHPKEFWLMLKYRKEHD